MQINRISPFNHKVSTNNTTTPRILGSQYAPNISQRSWNNQSMLPLNFNYNTNISFTGRKNIISKIPLIELENYKKMPNQRKERFRNLCSNFCDMINESQRETLLSVDSNSEFLNIPLNSEENMDKFIQASKMYSKYKEHPIICLGRSPKWFLNASYWMKDGIKDYKFVAFSGRWFWIYDGDFHDNRGLTRMDKWAPNKTEEKAYLKYLKNIQADPISIIKKTQEAGKKTIITDYVDTGKGFTSFLEVLSKYADEMGVLDEFAHSIDILSIGNLEYRRNRKKVKYISDPHVYMPPLLEKYDIPTTAWGTGQVISQNYYDIDYTVFKELLINQNPNECRSTYYPCHAWTIFQPDKFKVTMMKDLAKMKKMINDFMATMHTEKTVYIFDPVLSAYRNLLSFRILDGLHARGLLR